MRILITIVAVFLLTTVALGQASGDPNKDAKVKEELQKLISELNEASSNRDQASLERVYADEFQFIHSTGRVINKTAQITGIMSNDSVTSAPVPLPSFDQLLVYGDVAILRVAAKGATGTSIYAKKDGRWQIVQVQGTRLPPERKPIKLDPQVLDSYLGKYEFAPGSYATVTKEGDALKWQAAGRMKVTLIPLSDTRFYANENDAEMTFYKGDKGQVTDVVLRLGVCQESKAKKVSSPLSQTGSSADASPETGQQKANRNEDQEQTKSKIKVSGPIGSQTNPVRCDDPSGERQYLSRLRCANRKRPTFARIGSFGVGPYGNILDGYKVKCENSDEVTIFMDMYHEGYVEKEAVPGFTIERE